VLPRSQPLIKMARHYIRDIVYAANDGMITTFAVVAGVRGARLGPLAVLALGFANLAADGLSMAIGNYLGIKSERAAELEHLYQEWDETVHAGKHGAVTWASFMVAGLIPLLPFCFGSSPGSAFWVSVTLTGAGLFTVGATRTLVTRRPAWRSGLEMLLVGALAGAVAFLAGRLIESVLAAA
jgi:VIT1/CCC1 family predicted Fe2+/Mn2+ transporter